MKPWSNMEKIQYSRSESQMGVKLPWSHAFWSIDEYIWVKNMFLIFFIVKFIFHQVSCVRLSQVIGSLTWDMSTNNKRKISIETHSSIQVKTKEKGKKVNKINLTWKLLWEKIHVVSKTKWCVCSVMKLIICMSYHHIAIVLIYIG